MVERNILQLQPTDQTVPMTDWLSNWISYRLNSQRFPAFLCATRLNNASCHLSHCEHLPETWPGEKNRNERTEPKKIMVWDHMKHVIMKLTFLQVAQMCAAQRERWKKNSTWEVFNWGKIRLEPVIKASQESRIVCRHFWTLCLKNGMRQFLRQG